MKNKIIFDWLAFTVHGLQVDEVVDLLGLNSVVGEFVDGRGYNGYQDRLYFESISIHYNGKPNQGIHVELTGQGCRAWETYSDIKDYDTLLHRIFSIEKYKITRLDIAYDDFCGFLPIDQIVDSVRFGEWLSPANMQWWESVYSSAGLSCYIGSPRSNIRFRFYDKGAEQKVEFQWTRLEIQLRDTDATFFLERHFFDKLTLQELFFGIVNRYIKFINLDNPRKTRCSVKDWWLKFLETDNVVKLERPGVTYNLNNLINSINRSGNFIQTYISIFSAMGLLQELNRTHPVKDLPKKYKMLLKNYLDDYSEGHIKLVDQNISGEVHEVLTDLPKLYQDLLDELEQ